MAFNEIFTFGDPGAVTGLVVFGVILSAYHILRTRPWTHISKEVFELFPSTTNLDSLIASAAPNWPLASVMHASPTVKGGRSTHSMDEIWRFPNNPVAIPGFVVPSFIDSIQYMFLGRKSYFSNDVSVKVLELLPSFANSYSVRSARFIRGGFFVRASRLHIRPRSVHARSMSALAMCANTVSSHLIPQAVATAVRMIANKAACFNFHNSAAVTLASPKPDSIPAWCFCNDQETSRTHSSQVMDLHL